MTPDNTDPAIVDLYRSYHQHTGEQAAAALTVAHILIHLLDQLRQQHTDDLAAAEKIKSVLVQPEIKVDVRKTP